MKKLAVAVLALLASCAYVPPNAAEVQGVPFEHKDRNPAFAVPVVVASGIDAVAVIGPSTHGGLTSLIETISVTDGQPRISGPWKLMLGFDVFWSSRRQNYWLGQVTEGGLVRFP